MDLSEGVDHQSFTLLLLLHLGHFITYDSAKQIETFIFIYLMQPYLTQICDSDSFRFG